VAGAKAQDERKLYGLECPDFRQDLGNDISIFVERLGVLELTNMH